MAANKALEALELIAKAKTLVEEYVNETSDDDLDEGKGFLLAHVDTMFEDFEQEELHFVFMSCGGY